MKKLCLFFWYQVSVKGKRAWSYDNTRRECYYHQLESDKPDLNLWNPDVRQELEVCKETVI